VRVIASDPAARAGFTNDPAETATWCAWLRVAGLIVYAYPWRVRVSGDWL